MWGQHKKFCNKIMKTYYFIEMNFSNSHVPTYVKDEDSYESNGFVDMDEVLSFPSEKEAEKRAKELKKYAQSKGDDQTSFSVVELEMTYDVEFNDENDTNSKGFELSRKECEDWIRSNRDDEYFRMYAGGTVSIRCNQTEDVVMEENI